MLYLGYLPLVPIPRQAAGAFATPVLQITRLSLWVITTLVKITYLAALGYIFAEGTEPGCGSDEPILTQVHPAPL